MGKCRSCKTQINYRYPIVELLAALGAYYLFPKNFNITSLASSLMYFSILCSFIVHFFIDLEHKILPDSINIYLGIIFFIISISKYHYMHWLLGGAIGFLFPLGVTYLFYLVRNQVGLGGGDIKLFGVLGLYLGPLGIIHNILFSCILGSIVGVSLMATKVLNRSSTIPFGPFILIIATLQIFFPNFFSKITAFIF